MIGVGVARLVAGFFCDLIGDAFIDFYVRVLSSTDAGAAFPFLLRWTQQMRNFIFKTFEFLFFIGESFPSSLKLLGVSSFANLVCG